MNDLYDDLPFPEGNFTIRGPVRSSEVLVALSLSEKNLS